LGGGIREEERAELAKYLNEEEGEEDEAEEQDTYEADEEEDAEDNDNDIDYQDEWFESTGDFTKRYNRMRQVQQSQQGQQPQQPQQTARPAVNKPAAAPAKLPVAIAAKLERRINLDNLEDTRQAASANASAATGISNRASNDIGSSSRKAEGDRTKTNVDRQNRATVEQVLDPRTRLILFKLITKNVIDRVNGCVSTGKEANVYHATTSAGEDRAVKVYKTSILVFKDRDRYVSGEFRFRHGYSKGNPRQMVKVWAEKEMRNLKRYVQ